MIVGDDLQDLLDQLADAGEQILSDFMDPARRADAYAARAAIAAKLRDRHEPGATEWAGWNQMHVEDLDKAARIRARLERGR